ncbi:hypothetical protein QM007_09420 [Rothia sp. SD9660Na]|uniref:hypothetical protein n=1 Tax=Rothia sp. SD9660Na TaxID=3047030 RepID=UPI0024B89E30|nr:hypothetical protein [Rothia sp. SD9660Na]WHS50124.1 hypothetical protein QM007_09420 [Rothia sp. SD9660Na]
MSTDLTQGQVLPNASHQALLATTWAKKPWAMPTYRLKSSSASTHTPSTSPVCPASLVINWQRETEKFTAIPTHLAHGDARDAALAAWKADGGLLITTYDGARLYADATWRADAVILTEPQFKPTIEAQAIARAHPWAKPTPSTFTACSAPTPSMNA